MTMDSMADNGRYKNPYEEITRVMRTMMAPQRTLWSTPEEVIKEALSDELLNLRTADHFADFGCGDGRVLAYAAEKYECKCKGYEINSSRAEEARNLLRERGIQPEQAQVYTTDVLEADFEWPSAIFLYLIPRGLRRVLKRIQQATVVPSSDQEKEKEWSKSSRHLKVVTLLYPFPKEIVKPDRVKWVTTSIDACKDEQFKWPLYFYTFRS